MVTVSGIAIFPLKSARGGWHPEARVEPWGLAGDRRWAAVDPDGNRVRAAEWPRIFSVTAAAGPDDALILRADGLVDLRVKAPVTGEPVATGIKRLDHAILAGPAAHAWLSEALGRKVRLVWLDDPARRTVAADHGGRDGDVLSLADAAPLLVTSKTSLDQLDEWAAATAADAGEELPKPLDMLRFRPNLVLDGLPPFAEDGLRRIAVGDIRFRFAERCDRCAMTLYDPATVERGKEPLRTLARHRREYGKTWFGIRMIPENTGDIRVGDPVTIL